MDEKQQAIEQCSCPRKPGEALAAPLCAVDKLLGSWGELVMFLNKDSIPPYCKNMLDYGGAKCCTCRKRWQVYQAWGI